MTILTLATLAAALLGAPEASAADSADAPIVRIEAEAGSGIRTVETALATLPEPTGEGAMGGPPGPFELDEEQAIEVEGAFRPAGPFTIAPDPALARRYAPRPAGPVNRLTIPF